MKIRDELLALKTNGLIDARNVVNWARENLNSALHGALDWDDVHAAEEHRVWQVRRLIAVHIVDVDGFRSCVSLSIDRKEGGYRAITDVLPKPDMRAIMLKDALAELERVRVRYQHLRELAAVWEAKALVEQRMTTKVRADKQRRKAA